ncbi:RDD family protein [Micromonospora globbae]|uniref:RDD family protein n=1 Tax=Micromonospora globbae TaxID=1894969 RepID=A0A420EYY9_9ACTN|nr:RDD family protein [Micromonospora globbae]RKF25900.1 RDD family protein [Micromonospora globbae]WTF85894.1 RDD family protein [Micromonospora globbae]
MSVQPGWYVDPADPETRRYWDGEGWIGAPIPVDATPPEGPPPVEAPPPAPVPQPVTSPGAPPAPAPPGAPASAPPAVPGSAPPAAGPPPGWQPPPGYGHPGLPPGWTPPGWAARMPEPRPHGLPLAGLGARLIARLIDFGIVLALNVVVNGWFVWRLVQEMAPYWREVFRRAMAGNSSTEGLPQIGEQAGGLQVAILLIATALWLAYEVPTMASSGQTFGKRVMGIRAVPLTADQPLGFGRALRRWNTLGLPTLLWYCCGLGLLLQLIDAISPLFDHPLRQALHDKRAQTVVVQVPRHTPTATRSEPPGDTP